MDAEPGEDLLLVNFEHLPVGNPYRSCYAVYVREGASESGANIATKCPTSLLRACCRCARFGTDDMLMAGEVIEGTELDPLLRAWLADPATGFIHVHNAKPGCFAAEVRRG